MLDARMVTTNSLHVLFVYPSFESNRAGAPSASLDLAYELIST
jgi:hypothetical protein